MKTSTDRSLCFLACAGIVLFSFFGAVQAHGSPFRNLNFEDAVIGTPVDFQVPSSEALPYWDNNNYNPGYVLYDYTYPALGGLAAISVQDGLSGYTRHKSARGAVLAHTSDRRG